MSPVGGHRGAGDYLRSLHGGRVAETELTPLAPEARLLFYLQAFSRLVLFWAPVLASCGSTHRPP